MKTSSPLRYPGGKSALAGLLNDIRCLNGLGNRAIAEPFAGGAGASLTLLFLEEAPTIYINDADPAIYDFWWTVVNRPQPFLDMLSSARVSIAEWRRQRAVYRGSCRVSQLRRGFAAFYLNRCNRSGIIMNGGPIGGIAQAGEWKLDARFNRIELRRRCEKIAEYSGRIFVSCDDGLRFLKRLDPGSTFFFIDPPYFEKGPSLYLNALDKNYHAALSTRLKAMSDAAWVLTYDDCPEVRRLYCDWAEIRPFSLRYAAAERRPGNEVLITPKWMRLPTHQASAAVVW
ncbi:MAG: DNA adenine methylase [Elusimicrobiota bacterium]